MSSSATWAILHQYRRLLKAAAVYPSKNRASIAQEIRQAYREDASKQGAAATAALQQAKIAEDQLCRFPKEDTFKQEFEYTQR